LAWAVRKTMISATNRTAMMAGVIVPGQLKLEAGGSGMVMPCWRKICWVS